MNALDLYILAAAVTGTTFPGFGHSTPDRFGYTASTRYARSRPGERRHPQAGDKLARKAAEGKIGMRG